MAIEHIKKIITDLESVITDVKHRSIFAVLADFKQISEDSVGLLPEFKNLHASDIPDLAEAMYGLIKTIVEVMAGA